MENEQVKQVAHRYPMLLEWSEEKGGWMAYVLGLGIAEDFGVEEFDDDHDLPVVISVDTYEACKAKVKNLLMTGSPLPEPVVIPNEYKR